MILTEERLRSSSPPVDAHLVLQIHDELVWEVKDQDVDRAVGKYSIFDAVDDHKVKLLASVSSLTRK